MVSSKENGNIVRIGVLACQGSFAEHISHLQSAGDVLCLDGTKCAVEVEEIRSAEQFTENLDGLVIPGGESTTMSRFLERNTLLEPLKIWMNDAPNDLTKPVWGTCAGLILLSNVVTQMKENGQQLIGGLDICTERNALGRQRESYEVTLKIETKDDDEAAHTILTKSGMTCQGIFIRAPQVISVDNKSVSILASTTISTNLLESSHDNQLPSPCPVAVRQGYILGLSFHPELTLDLRWHRYFIEMIRNFKNKLQSIKTL